MIRLLLSGVTLVVATSACGAGPVPHGTVPGVRELTHDHANEQPFTRTLDVDIPDQVTAITVEGRDKEYGRGGETTTVDLPR